MESEINKMQTKLPSKNFSIESIVGINDRRSPEIDIENSISQDYSGTNDHSEDEELKVRDGKMNYYFQQNRVPNFPFFMSYDKRMGGFQSEQGGQQEELKRASPGSVRSEVDSDGVDDRQHVN
ncbi:hypothetical protein SFRURICE_020907 [Spodoptera frugiperda]|nr:hypothetical protein SFRURICE_020907 [Spodoptera frugiperda]